MKRVQCSVNWGGITQSNYLFIVKKFKSDHGGTALILSCMCFTCGGRMKYSDFSI